MYSRTPHRAATAYVAGVEFRLLLLKVMCAEAYAYRSSFKNMEKAGEGTGTSEKRDCVGGMQKAVTAEVCAIEAE